MTLTTFPDLVQGSDEWLAARRGIVTASVVGRLVSARPYGPAEYGCPACDAEPGDPCRSKVKKAGETGAPIKTMHPERAAIAESGLVGSPLIVEPATGPDARALTTLLVAERITGWTDPVYVNDDMWRGVEDEPRARDRYSQAHAPVTQTGFMVRDDWGFKIGASPDGLVGTDGGIEVKSRRAKKHLQTILADAVPTENIPQIQCCLLVSGRKWWDYVSYCGGMPLWTKRVYPDPAWHAAIAAAVEAFEQTAAEMATTYDELTAGLPMTERIDLDRIVI